MKGMNKCLLLLMFVFGLSVVSAFSTVTVTGYDCDADGLSCSSVDSNSGVATAYGPISVTLNDFNKTNYCNINTVDHIFKYDVSVSDSINDSGVDPSNPLAKVQAFTCGVCYKDNDGDNNGDDTKYFIDKDSESCLPGYIPSVVAEGDCDDLDNTIYFGAPELCDYKDNDCNTVVDDNQDCVYWADMNGVNRLDNVSLGDSIRLLFGGYGNYSVYDDDGNDLLTSTLGLAPSEIVLWTPQAEGEYYFKTNTTGAIKSVVLDVLPTTGDNDPVNVTFLSPACGSNFSKGVEITINVSAYDIDDLLYGNVTVNGNWILDLTNGVQEINYTLIDHGNIPIVAYVENARGEKQKVVSNIMVVDKNAQEKYTAACIDEPKNFERLRTSAVNFKAHSSAGIDCSSGTCIRYESDSNKLNYIWAFSTHVGSRHDGFSRTGDNIIAREFPYQYPYPGLGWAKLEIEVL